MGSFERNFYKTEDNQGRAIEQLQKMPWFEFLKKDIKCGEVFPALRNKGKIDFYYKGACICKYKGNMYGEPIVNKSGQPLQPANHDNYEEIKRECERWAETVRGASRERAALSKLYTEFSPYVQLASSMILLDIEVGFPWLYLDDKKKHGNIQVDLLFLDKSSGMLYFVEAKEAGDKRIKRKYSGQSADELFESLEVREQLNKYNANIAERKEQILTAYRDYLNIMGEIFDCEIYSGELKLYEHAKLLIYGKSSDNGIKSLEAIRMKLGKDLIVFENGLDNTIDLPQKIVDSSLHV